MPDQIKSKKNLLGRQVVKTKATLKNAVGADSKSYKSKNVYDKKGDKIKTISRTKSLVKRDDFGQKDKSFGEKNVVKKYQKKGMEVRKTNYLGRDGKSAIRTKDVTRTIKNSNSNTSKPSETIVSKVTTRGKESKGLKDNKKVFVEKAKNDEQNMSDRRTPSTGIGQAKLYRGAIRQAKSQARQIKKTK